MFSGAFAEVAFFFDEAPAWDLFYGIFFLASYSEYFLKDDLILRDYPIKCWIFLLSKE